MTRTASILATAGVAPQIGLAISIASVLPILQAISLTVGIVAGLSMLYFGWNRELRHRRKNDLQDDLARDYLRSQRRDHRTMSIDCDMADAGFKPDADLTSEHYSTHRPNHDQ